MVPVGPLLVPQDVLWLYGYCSFSPCPGEFRITEFQSNGVDPDNAELPSPHSSTQQSQGEGGVAISHAVHRGAVIPGFWPSWEGAVSRKAALPISS